MCVDVCLFVWLLSNCLCYLFVAVPEKFLGYEKYSVCEKYLSLCSCVYVLVDYVCIAYCMRLLFVLLFEFYVFIGLFVREVPKYYIYTYIYIYVYVYIHTYIYIYIYMFYDHDNNTNTTILLMIITCVYLSLYIYIYIHFYIQTQSPLRGPRTPQGVSRKL